MNSRVMSRWHKHIELAVPHRLYTNIATLGTNIHHAKEREKNEKGK